MVLPPALRPDFNCLFNCFLSSRTDSTVKKYLKEINKFLLWCRTKINFATVAIFFFCYRPLPMVLVHAALKWLHSFVPDDGPNPKVYLSLNLAMFIRTLL